MDQVQIRRLFVEAKKIQAHLWKINWKQEVDDFKAFDKQMESGKISNALRCLSDDAKGGVISISDKVTIKGKTFTLVDLLQEKHPCS